jgi:hypothetical protein
MQIHGISIDQANRAKKLMGDALTAKSLIQMAMGDLLQ